MGHSPSILEISSMAYDNLTNDAASSSLLHFVKRTSSTSSENHQTDSPPAQDKPSSSASGGSSQLSIPLPLFKDGRPKLRMPQLFQAMKTIMAKHQQEIPASKYKYEPVVGHKDKLSVRVEGTDERFELDIDPVELIEPMKRPRKDPNVPTPYQLAKARAMEKGQLEAFVHRHRMKAAQRYQRMKKEGKPSHSYRHLVAKFRKGVLQKKNNHTLLEQEKQKKRLLYNQDGQREKASALRKVGRHLQTAEEILARKRLQSRKSSAKYNAKMKLAKFKSTSFYMAEPSHANHVLNSSDYLAQESPSVIDPEALGAVHLQGRTSSEEIDLTGNARKGKMTMIDLNKCQNSIDLNQYPEEYSGSTTSSSD